MIDKALRTLALTGAGLAALSVAIAAPAAAQSNPAAPAAEPVLDTAAEPALKTAAEPAPEAAADQAAGRAAEAGAARAGEDIVVTGTRVVRNGFQSPTPLTVLTIEDIQNSSPTNNLADFVNQIPSVAGSVRPANSTLAISSGLAGINALNLRNLGEVRTLVLLDGRRSVGSSLTGLVDVNDFPQALVKSVEVVTGGASAAYGSDAVAGVVNFVLDKTYTGLKVAIDSGISDRGDSYNYSLSVAGGTAFAGGRGHLLVSGEVAHRDGIFDVDRDWNQIGYRTVGNPAYTATNGLPQNLVVTGAGTWNITPGSIVRSQVGGTGLTGTYFAEGGAVRRYQFGSITDASQTVGGDWQINDQNRRVGLDASDDRRGVFARASYDVADWLQVYGEASYNWHHALFNSGPQAFSYTLRSDNAYLINALGRAALTGVTSVTLATSSVDVPNRQNDNTREVQRYTLGAGGDFRLFGNKAVWSAYGQYGRTDTHEQLNNIMNTARLALATDAVFAPAGNALGVAAGTIVCRSSLTTPTDGCTPYDRLGIGVASQAAIGYVLGNPYRDQRFEQTVGGINLSVTPFATWAGDVSVAIGGEYRKEQVSGDVPAQYRSGWSVGNFLPTFGSYDVKEAYLETVVPLGSGVEFNGAVRGTDYSTSGYVTTWKAGLTWQPVEDVRFRVTQSRDIRAPNLAELYQAGTSRTNTFGTSASLGQYAGKTYLETTTGNLALLPEKADSTNVGVVVQPRFLPGFSVSVDGFLIKVRDAIDQFYSDSIAARCLEGNQSFCDSIAPGGASGRDFVISASPFNFSRITTRGIDYEASYRLPLEALFNRAQGNVILRGLATHYIDKGVDNGITVPVDVAGQNSGGGSPSWIYRVSATVDTPTFSITATGRGISSGTISNTYIECTTGCPASTTLNPTIDNNHVDGAFYGDLNLTTKVDFGGAAAQVFLNVTNVFDRDPILLPTTGVSANTTFSDLLGRAFRVGIRMQTR